MGDGGLTAGRMMAVVAIVAMVVVAVGTMTDMCGWM